MRQPTTTFARLSFLAVSIAVASAGCERRERVNRIPNLICRGDTGLYVVGSTLRADRVLSEAVYTIRNDSLLVAERGSPEVHYNNLVLPHPYRATTNFLTIDFLDNRFDGRAVMVRDHGRGDASVVHLQCSLAAAGSH